MKKRIISTFMAIAMALGCAGSYPANVAQAASTKNQKIIMDKKYKLDITGDSVTDNFKISLVSDDPESGWYSDINVSFYDSNRKKKVSQNLAEKYPMSFMYWGEQTYEDGTTESATDIIHYIRLKSGKEFFYLSLPSDNDYHDVRFYEYKPAIGKLALVKTAYPEEMFKDGNFHHAELPEDAVEGDTIHLNLHFNGGGSGIGSWDCDDVVFGYVDKKLQPVKVNSKGVMKARTDGTFTITHITKCLYDEEGNFVGYNDIDDDDCTLTLAHVMYVYTDPGLSVKKKDTKKKAIKLKAGTELEIKVFYSKEGKSSYRIKTVKKVNGKYISGWIKNGNYYNQTTDMYESYFKETVAAG